MALAVVKLPLQPAHGLGDDPVVQVIELFNDLEGPTAVQDVSTHDVCLDLGSHLRLSRRVEQLSCLLEEDVSAADELM